MPCVCPQCIISSSLLYSQYFTGGKVVYARGVQICKDLSHNQNHNHKRSSIPSIHSKLTPGLCACMSSVWALCHFKCNTGIDSIGLILNAMSSFESWLNPFGIDALGLRVCVWMCVFERGNRKCMVETADTVCVHACMRSLIKALEKATTSGLCDLESQSLWLQDPESGPSSSGFISPLVKSHPPCSLFSFPHFSFQSMLSQLAYQPSLRKQNFKHT